MGTVIPRGNGVMVERIARRSVTFADVVPRRIHRVFKHVKRAMSVTRECHDEINDSAKAIGDDSHSQQRFSAF